MSSLQELKQIRCLQTVDMDKILAKRYKPAFTPPVCMHAYVYLSVLPDEEQRPIVLQPLCCEAIITRHIRYYIVREIYSTKVGKCFIVPDSEQINYCVPRAK